MDKDSKRQRQMEDSVQGYFLQWKDTALNRIEKNRIV